MGDQAEDVVDVEFKVRQYQEELFEKACKGNTIICLKTGAGKTFIAIMLIKSLQHEIKKPYKENGKRTFFLVPKVPLVSQQASAIRNHTILKVGEYCGAKGVDAWTREQWEKELVANEVLVMTAQILVNMLKDGYVKLDRVNLLVFDECHVATGKSPYCAVMARYKDFGDRPRILGLTASILNKKCKPCRVEHEMKQLEIVLDSRIESVENLDTVNRYATKPREIIIVCAPSDSMGDVETHVVQLILRGFGFMKPILDAMKTSSNQEAFSETSMFTEIQKARNMTYIMEVLKKYWEDEDSSDAKEFSSSPDVMLKYIHGILGTLGLWCTKNAVDSFLLEIPKLTRTAREQLQDNKVTLYDILETSLCQIQSVLDAHFRNYSTKQAMLKSVSPRVRRLIELLEALRPAGNGGPRGENHEFRGIIFVQQRIIAWALTDYLQKLAECVPETFGYLKTCYIVGHGVNVNFLKKSSMNINQQSTVLHSFRTGATNLMVATQVVEEGLDIPKCNAVIRFDPPKNFTSYVQSMGRARAEKALYVLLVDPVEKGQLVNDITVYKMVECILNVESHNRSLPTEEDFDGFLEDYHVLEPYYPTNREGAAVSINTAMETLNRYCNNLPHDRYTQLGPKFRYMKKPGDITKICCSITLPFGALGFTREPIVGKFMTDKKLARKAAAFEACVRLHREGELNDNLMPARNYIERYDEQLGIIPMEDFPKSTPTPGTKKRRQVYDKQVADDLSHAFPNSGESSYLYAICFDAEECDETIGNQPCYGILTSKPIRNVCAFTLYGKATYMVRLRCLTENFKIDQANLSSLEEFHCFLFRDVLHLATEAMEYCPQDVKFSLLIVPLTVTPSRNAFIDWELVIRCQEYENAMHTDDDDCTDCPSKGDVVVPQYGESSLRGRRFYVLRVCHELTPQTPFSKYSSFEHYMRLKYETQLTNLEQPLLLVDYIPNTLNVLHPQLVRDSATNLRRQQHQIPELCKIYPMNIHSVSQAFFVPSTLHRLNGLLLAQQLRDRVIVEANLPLQIGVSPEPLPLLEALCTACRITEDTIFSPYGFLGDTDPTLLGALIFQALTTSSADNWSDLERLEVVGDSFLKFAISVFLFCTIGSLNEGGLSTLRTGLVKNFNLYSHAKDKEIPGLLNASMFQPRLMWLSPGFRFPEGLRQALLAAGVQRHLWPHAVPTDTRSFANDDEGWVAELMRRWADTNPAQRESVQINAGQTPCPPFNDSFEDDDGEPASPDGACDYYTQQLMGDKTVADAAEAIIGAVLLFCGQDAALRFISWLGLKVQPDTYPWTPPKSALVMALPQEKLDEIYVGQDDLERQLGYTFKEKSFLRQALIHPSYMREPVTDNYQRLEFLGDAILDFLVTMNLYKMHPDLSPGDMTDLRSSLVNNVTFGYLTVKNELHKHLKYSSHNLFQVIDRYIKHIDTMEHPKDVVYLINEDETVELEEVEIPKALGDVFEAIAGAIFIDSGLSLEAVWKVYYPMMKDVMDKYSTQLPINPIRFLLEKFPQTIFGKPVNHDGSYTVEVICNGQRFTGLSRNKTFAKQAAAKSALRAFNILSTRSMS